MERDIVNLTGQTIVLRDTEGVDWEFEANEAEIERHEEDFEEPSLPLIGGEIPVVRRAYVGCGFLPDPDSETVYLVNPDYLRELGPLRNDCYAPDPKSRILDADGRVVAYERLLCECD